MRFAAIFLLGLVWAPHLEAAVVTRGPYLQQATPDSYIIKWRTDVSTRTYVRYGIAPGQLTAVVSNSTLTTNHVIQITNLAANTKYFYEIGTASAWFPGDTNTYFVTSPPAGASQPTRLWVIGDSGTADAHAANVRNAYRTVARTRKADLMLMLGDNAYNSGTDSEYQRAVFDMYPDVLQNTTVWPTIGNHETTVTPYLSIFTLPQQAEAGGIPSGTERYYSFDYGNIHFICLDSWSSDRGSNAPMCAWLRMDLETTTADWLIAFWHHPPYTKGSHDSDTEGELVAMRRNALPILESYGVDLVLCGHSHSYERSFLLDGHYGTSSGLSDSMLLDDGDGRDDGDGAYRKTTSEGVVYVVAGSSGKLGGGDLDHPAMFVSLNVLGSMVIDVASNRLDATFLRTNGTPGDYFTLIKAPPATNPPAAPSGLMATVVSSSRIDLSWTDHADNEQGFQLERSTNGIDYVEFATVSANAENRSDTGLSPETPYYYRLRAFNGFGPSPYSDPAQGTTMPAPAADVTAPAAVANLFVSGFTSNNVTLSWTAPGDDGMAGIASSYDVRYSTSPITSNTWHSAIQSTGEPAPTESGASQSMSIGSLTQGVTYYFALTTTDEADNVSALSNVATGTPNAPVLSNELVLIASNSMWRYLDNGSNQGSTWRAVIFDDSAWFSGEGKFGYGFGDEATVISYGPSSSSKYITTYFRRAFTIDNPDRYTNLLVQLLRDDGAIVHVNGIEVYRSNMPEGPITYVTPATAEVLGSGSYRYYPRVVSPTVLRPGTNVVAVELHQRSASGTDVSFDLQLSATDRCALELPPDEAPLRLSITRSGNEVVITWPATCAASLYVLERNSTVDGTSGWHAADGLVDIVGGHYRMTVALQQEQAIYRLRRL